MKTKTLLQTVGAAVLAVGFGLAGSAGNAAMFDLTKEQIEDAVNVGKKQFDQHPTAFMWPYYTDTGYGYPAVLLRTEYFAVSDYVRRSEFQRKYGSQRVHKLTDERIEDARKEVAGVLQFLVTIYGPSEDFMKDWKFHLMATGKQIAPKAVDKPQVATRAGFAGKIAYMANVIVDFPRDGLKGDEQVTLVVDPPNGLGPSGARNESYKVPFNLAKLK